MSLILKNKKGKVIDKCGYEEESGNILYKEKKVGVFELDQFGHGTQTLAMAIAQ